MDERTLARFISWVEVQPNGCWRWRGKTNRQGYGYFWLNGKSRLAHRVAFEHFVGPIPEGYEIDHNCHSRDSSCPGGVCEHRACVRWEDLEAVTELENVMRSRGLAAANAAKEFCANQHRLTEDNVYRYPDGRERGCRACRTNARKKWAQENRPRKGKQPPQTHCPRDHEMTPENTYVDPRGRRTCRTCQRDRLRESQRQRRARLKDAAETGN